VKQRALLGMLLLKAGEPTSADRLIEELWGGSPPADAATALQAHVSRLRKILEPAHGGDPKLLLTKREGYTLEIAPEQLDLHEFESLLRHGRRQLESGDPRAAADTLREALGLWHGGALAGLEYEPFAAEPIRRLEDLRLEASETRFEADLALGRHSAVAAELDPLVREHPLRERLRGQLMLALYRSGRQADALAVYDEGRRVLVEELGIEPGARLQQLHAQILGQDPALAGPNAPRGEAAASPTPVPIRRIALALGGLAVVAVAVTATVLLTGADESEAVPTSGAVYPIAVQSGERDGDPVEVGGSPAAITTEEGGVWALDADGQTISRIAGEEVSTFGVGATPIDLEAGAGALWVEVGERVEGGQIAGPIGTAVARVDPTTSTVRARIPLPRAERATSTASDDQIAVEPDAVWVIGPDHAVSRIDPRTDRVTQTIRGLAATAIATGDAGTWALTADGTVARIASRGNRFVDRTRIGASAVASIAVGAEAVWVSAPGDGTVWRLDPADRPALRTIDVGAGATALAFGEDSLWVANPLRGTVSRIDPAQNEVTATAELDGSPRAVAVGGDTVWSAVAPGGDGPLPSEHGAAGSRVHSACEPTFYGGEGEPDALIVSDLPLQGGLRISSQQMVQAIALVVRSNGYRAGDLTIGYQSCDDSVARTGLFDEDKCAANARAYLGDPRVLGIVGTLNSPCSVAALPVLNAGTEPAPAMISPLNSYGGLTRPAPGSPSGELETLYPSGERNFARVYPADDHQATALANFARELGAERVVALDDGDLLYGGMLADRFAREATGQGLDVVEQLRWDTTAADYEDLAARVAAARPDAVFLGGTLSSGGAAVLRALRQELGREPALLVPDGFTGTSLLVDEAGDAATGVYVSLSGMTIEDLPDAGKRFADELGETLPGVPIEMSAIYAAAATEVLMDAIERSDASRSSVVDELFATELEDSPIGPIEFDQNGDQRAAPTTILRIEPGARDLSSFPDAVLEHAVGVDGT